MGHCALFPSCRPSRQRPPLPMVALRARYAWRTMSALKGMCICALKLRGRAEGARQLIVSRYVYVQAGPLQRPHAHSQVQP